MRRAFDSLTLYGQPLPPFAWTVMATSYLSILLEVLYLRSKFGPGSRRCVDESSAKTNGANHGRQEPLSDARGFVTDIAEMPPTIAEQLQLPRVVLLDSVAVTDADQDGVG